MKKILLAFGLFAFFHLHSQAQTLEPQKAAAIHIAASKRITVAPLEITKAQSLTIIVEIGNEMSPETFQRIKRTNRYLVEGKQKGKNFQILMPNLDKTMKINGEPVQEHITIYVRANDDYKLNKNNNLVFANSKQKKTFDQPIEVEIRLAEPEASMGAPNEKNSTTTTNKAAIKPNGKHGDILIDDVPIDPF